MEEKHKDILLIQRVNLVDNINVRGGLYTQLLARKVLTKRQIQNIKSARTISEQTEELLDELEQSGSTAFDLFCEALTADKQEEIVELYLKPPDECKQKEDVPTCDRSQDGKPTTARSVVPQTESCSGVNSPCSGDVNIVSDSGGPGGAQRVISGVAVREEYQQQTFRRSIEPGTLALQKPNLPMGMNLEHDAYYFYQNSIARPSLGSTALNSQFIDGVPLKSDKESLISSQGAMGRDTPQLNLMTNTEKSFMKEVPVQVYETGFVHNNNMSSYPLLNAHPTNVFNHPSSASSSVPSLSRSPLKGLNPFTFQTVDSSGNHPSSVQSKFEISSQTESIPQRYSSNIMNDRMPFTHEPFGVNHGKIETHSTSAPITTVSSVQLSNLSPSKQHATLQRSCLEIPRYIELNNPTTSQREMMSFAHHIETLPVRLQATNGQVQPDFVVQERNVPRLLKNDSVDTMNKRPSTEVDERLAKRSKEDPDCIHPEKLSTVHPMKLSTATMPNPAVDKTLIVPVIGESQKGPSMPSVVIETEYQPDFCQKGALQGVMDDPEIDLTDGPIDVKVDHCTRQFYLSNFKKSYSMRRIPRGKALILNVNEVTGKPPRRGTDIDRENLHNLLCQLHFDVTVFNDEDGLTAKEMVLKLQDFSQDAGHRNGESAVICILSHGEEGYIFGSDGKKFELEGAFSLFDNTSCPLLRGKPKIFIVQACRGGALDRGVQYYTDEHDGSDARLRQCPSMSDMLICYPTQNGYYAWRNRDRGSWYVEALVQVFMKYAKCEDICTMLNRFDDQVSNIVGTGEIANHDFNSSLRQAHIKQGIVCETVNLLVSKKVSNCPQIEMDQMSQMSEYKSTLRMPHLFFFPGIGTLM